MKKIFITLFITFLLTHSANAFEECLIITNGKLTDIRIEDNTIVDVYPLITIENNKNTLIVHPLKQGKTRVCVLKNKNEKIMFDISIKNYKTEITEVKGFEILSVDVPAEIIDTELDIDLPPLFVNMQKENESTNIINETNPLKLRGCE